MIVLGAQGFLGRYLSRHWPTPEDRVVIDCLREETHLGDRIQQYAGQGRYVYLSSVAVTHWEQGGPQTNYVKQKHLSEVYARSKGAVVVRLPTIYGGGGWRSWPLQAVKALCVGSSVREMRSRAWAVREISQAVEG